METLLGCDELDMAEIRQSRSEPVRIRDFDTLLWFSLTFPAALGLDAILQMWPRLPLYALPQITTDPDPVNCHLVLVLEFLQDLFSARLTTSIFKVYVGAIYANDTPIDGASLGRHLWCFVSKVSETS